MLITVLFSCEKHREEYTCGVKIINRNMRTTLTGSAGQFWWHWQV